MNLTHDIFEHASSVIQNQDPVLEANVLSILIAFPGAFDSIGDRLESQHFVNPIHRLIFTELRQQLLAGKAPDVISLGDALKERVTYVEINDIARSHDFSQRNLKMKVDRLIAHYKSRKLLEVSNKIGELAFERTPIRERIDQAQALLASLGDEADADDWVDAYTLAFKHLEVIERRESGVVEAMSTGIPDLDELLDGGLQRGELGIAAARPSMGKTAIGTTVAESVAQRYSVALFSLEMAQAQLGDRLIASQGRIPISGLRRPLKYKLDYSRVVEGVEKTRDLKYHLCVKSGLNILDIRSRSRALKRKRGLDLVIVDYLGLMTPLDPRMPRTYQIEEITKGLKDMAKELDIAVIALAQVNRNVTDRADPVPTLADMKDSGGIEQDADWVGAIYRPIADKPDLSDEWKHYALFRMLKNRQGRIGDVHLFYQGDQTNFGSWSGPPPQSAQRTARKVPL